MLQTASALVVEDHYDTQNAVVAVLERAGLTVVTAGNGEEAIRQLEGGLRPRLMLIDLMLPKVSGWDLLQYLREQPELGQIPTVVLDQFSLGKSPRGSRRRVAQAGRLRSLDQHGSQPDRTRLR
jgi:CheY-like chemotaxis protein